MLGLLYGLARLLHLTLEFLDLYQVTRIERQRGVITVRFVRTETTVLRFLASRLHRRRQPELLEVPIELAQVADRCEILTRRNCAFVVDHTAGRPGVTRHLRGLRLLRLRDQAVHVD